MKKFIRFAAIMSALVLVPLSPAIAKEYSPVGVNEADGLLGVYIKDESIGPNLNSLVTDANISKDKLGHGKFCPTLETGGCSLGPDSNLNVMAMLPPCGDVTDNCIESVGIFKKGEDFSPAKYVKTVAGISFASTPGLGNPAGSMPSIWQSSGVLNEGNSDKFVVSAGLQYQVRGKDVQIVNFGVKVAPVVDVRVPGAAPATVRTVTNAGIENTVVFNGINSTSLECAATDTDYCAKSVDYTPGTRVRVTLRISNKVTGWLHGRVSNPLVAVEKISDSINRLTMEAEPVEVPEMYVAISVKAQPANIQESLKRFNSGGGDREHGSSWRTYDPESPDSYQYVQLFAGLAKDTAANTKTAWNLASFGEANGGNRCFSDTSKLIGVVTTNSLVYDGGVPSWDGQKLNYRVAGLHFMPDGKTPVEGTYDLAIRSDAARCLYGFSSAPISATISVTGANGENKVATTVVSEKDGWLHLAAYGFTFSSPTISVKLSQAAGPAKKTTITCVKGKLTKKVTAVGPKCPADYKKK
jgi:hypothetical protein